ncbi:recombinase family protein [Lysobacter sp. Hz 25]|uniref:recombinase family protein n=1 Tax=Lysobacter sp. Hz 25 TaxID=3383698 RepID=UPI0038D476C8
MSAPVPNRLRCAVYTRKSNEEGLEREYNSIEAQRDGGANYIASRRSEGWVPAEADYDELAVSARDMNRPVLRRLLDDIRSGRVDVVVVYRLDRLTRSMRDFPVLLDLFDQHSVTLVSITESINTTDASGRMNLTMMMAFAQFERELAVDRVRDKMVASKKKGLWMHGIPPLGYDVQERRLVVNHAEAAQVRMIFRRLIETQSIMAVVNDMRGMGYRSKGWTTLDGRVREPQPHDRSTIQKILHNRTYLGELKHLDQYFKESHQPIIEEGVWDQVQAVLATNAHARGNASRAKVHFLLKGLLVGPDQRALTPWHTTKRNGRMYRYYLSTAQIHEGKMATTMPRLPAQEVESIVVSYLRRLLTSSEMLELITRKAVALDRMLDEAKVTVAMRQFDQVWDALFPAEQQRLVKLLVEKIIVRPEAIEIRFYPNGIASLAGAFESQTVAA